MVRVAEAVEAAVGQGGNAFVSRCGRPASSGFRAGLYRPKNPAVGEGRNLLGSVTQSHGVAPGDRRYNDVGVSAMNRTPDIRWQQRFDNFDRALGLLREALANGPAALNQLEKEGVVQRFEYTLELAWKTIKDYLEESGVVLTAVTPRQVIKDAFAARILTDGQAWIDMVDHRNLLSHTYDPANFEDAVDAIHGRYLTAFRQVRDLLDSRRSG